MHRRISLFIFLCLIAVVAAASLVILYENGFLPQQGSAPIAQSSSWQNNLEHFATDFTVADGKFFVSDGWGNVYCFDAESGESIWNASLGGYTAGGSTIVVYEGKVYVGSRGSVVNKLDENTGKLELAFQAPVSTSYGAKSAPEFFVADGKVFASQNGVAVYNAATGELFWESSYSGIKLGNASGTASDSSFIFMRRTSRINPNNGDTLWSATGDASDPAVVVEGQVILWNYNSVGSSDAGQTVLSVSASSGATLWDFDVGARMFQPTVSNGLVLFGAEDGYFYAVNLVNGTLKWKTFIDDQKLIATFNGYTQEQQAVIHMRASLVQVDPQNQRVFWSVIVSNNGQDVYNGTIWSLNLSDGDRIWTLPVTNNALIDTAYGNFVSMTLSNNILYVTEHSDLYCIGEYTGSVQLRRNFEHYVLPPIAADNKVFVAADLYLIAYG